MAQVKDPVCGMLIDSNSAAGQSVFKNDTYYFCCEQCKRQFETNPDKYAGGAVSSDAGARAGLEQHEPPFTKSGGMTSPKFGSAGSGGAEYEQGPEKHSK